MYSPKTILLRPPTCLIASLVEYRITSISGMDATSAFTFEMIIVPVSSIIGRIQTDNLLFHKIVLFVNSKGKHFGV